MNVIIGLCHSYSGKVVTFQESFFACKRKLSKTSRLLRLAATGNCPDRLEILPVSVTRDRSRQTSGHPARQSGQLPVAARRRRRDVFESLRLQAKKRLLKGNNFSTSIVSIVIGKM